MRQMTLSSLVLLLAAGLAPGQDRPARWEYAELTARTTPARPGGTARDGAEVPILPAATTVRWTTGDAEVKAQGWDELAAKLNAPGKKDVTSHRLRVLNALGAEGWELVSQQAGTAAPFQPADPVAGGFGPRATTTTLLFKRRVR
jgi:hypothetical protein